MGMMSSLTARRVGAWIVTLVAAYFKSVRLIGAAYIVKYSRRNPAELRRVQAVYVPP